MATANMTPLEWAQRPIKKFADLNGRASRSEYWWFFLAVLVVLIVAKIIDRIIGMNLVGDYGPVALIVLVGTFVPNIAVSVRRLHDTNRSGWWILLPLVPYCIGTVLGGAAMVTSAAAGSDAGIMAGAGIAGIFMIVGAVCGLVILYFFVLPGTPGTNRYGPNPLGEGAIAPAE